MLQDNEDESVQIEMSPPPSNVSKRLKETKMSVSTRIKLQSPVKKVFKAVFRRRKHMRLKKSRPIVVDSPSTSSSSSTKRSMSLPHEIQILVDSAMSVYSAVSGSSGLPEPRGRSMMTSILPELSTDTESDASFFTHKTPIPKCLTPSDERHSSPPPPMVHRLSSRRTIVKSSYFTRTRYFKELVEESYENVDPNKTGFIDKKELYAGILLIHLNLSKYAGIAACKPATCERVFSVFDDVDVDRAGTLTKTQFNEAISILSLQILQRVAIQWSVMILIVVPIILQSMHLLQFIQYPAQILIAGLEVIIPIVARLVSEVVLVVRTVVYDFVNVITLFATNLPSIMYLLLIVTSGCLLVNRPHLKKRIIKSTQYIRSTKGDSNNDDSF